MIQLTRVNLLPYREEERLQKQKQFQRLLLLGGLGGLVASGLIYTMLGQAISGQEDRNQMLEQEINILNKQIAEVNQLKAEKASFLARKQKVEELQNQRFRAAKILDDLNLMMPDGTYLTAIKSDQTNGYTFTGRAISDNKIAMLMRALPSTGIFQQPELQSIRKLDDAQEFTLKAALVSAKPEGQQPAAGESVLDKGTK